MAKSFIQEYGVKFNETFIPVACLTSVCSLITVTALCYGLFFQINVKNAVLNGDLEKEVYMQSPPDLNSPSGKVYHLRRALYGLKQALQIWFAKFSNIIYNVSFSFSPHDLALFIRRSSHGTVLLLSILMI